VGLMERSLCYMIRFSFKLLPSAQYFSGLRPFNNVGTPQIHLAYHFMPIIVDTVMYTCCWFVIHYPFSSYTSEGRSSGLESVVSSRLESYRLTSLFSVFLYIQLSSTFYIHSAQSPLLPAHVSLLERQGTDDGWL